MKDPPPRAWYKLLYSDGDERTTMWGFIMDVVRKRRKSQEDLELGEEEEQDPAELQPLQDKAGLP